MRAPRTGGVGGRAHKQVVGGAAAAHHPAAGELVVLDHRVVDFAVNLPTESKLHNGWTKYVLRQSFPELPRQIRWRRDKQPFTTPEAHWLKYEFSGTISDLFKKSRLGELGILNDRKFLEYYDDFRGGSAIAHGDVCRTLIAEMWARKSLNLRPHLS